VIAGDATREQALARYGAFSAAHARKFRWLLHVQRGVGQLTPSRTLSAIVRALENRQLAGWLFGHYLAIAPPSFVESGTARLRPGPGRLAVAPA
jgi:hypothetical protein